MNPDGPWWVLIYWKRCLKDQKNQKETKKNQKMIKITKEKSKKVQKKYQNSTFLILFCIFDSFLICCVTDFGTDGSWSIIMGTNISWWVLVGSWWDPDVSWWTLVGWVLIMCDSFRSEILLKKNQFFFEIFFLFCKKKIKILPKFH